MLFSATTTVDRVHTVALCASPKQNALNVTWVVPLGANAGVTAHCPSDFSTPIQVNYDNRLIKIPSRSLSSTLNLAIISFTTFTGGLYEYDMDELAYEEKTYFYAVKGCQQLVTSEDRKVPQRAPNM